MAPLGREFFEREERIKWYIQLHWNYYLTKFAEATEPKEKEEYTAKLQKLQETSKLLYGS